RVLLIDSDPQGNATSGLGIDKAQLEKSLYDVLLGGASMVEVLCETEIDGLWLVPANSELVGAEVEIIGAAGRELRLKNALADLVDRYDYIFIDCPPSLGLLTINALVAAKSVLVTLQSEYYALEGISSLMQTIELAKSAVNPDLELEGVVLTMHDVRTNLSRQVESEAREFFGDKVFETVIPRNVRLSESPSFGRPIVLYDPQSVGAGAYQTLAREMLRRHGKPLNSQKDSGKKRGGAISKLLRRRAAG
ncbi:MAG: AAA family ATPase, partial [Bdellovibrionales bacterium]|nr:AAA family ATPase [Bdellovibrionales bacterium]